jgi:hypothetical protein
MLRGAGSLKQKGGGTDEWMVLLLQPRRPHYGQLMTVKLCGTSNCSEASLIEKGFTSPQYQRDAEAASSVSGISIFER